MDQVQVQHDFVYSQALRAIPQKGLKSRYEEKVPHIESAVGFDMRISFVHSSQSISQPL
jgi:hypothetical protein